MKILSTYLLTLVSIFGTSTAFTIPPQRQSISTISIFTLEASRDKKRLWKPIVSGGLMGWILATKIATASVTPQEIVHHIEYFSTQEDYPTIVLSQGAYTPEKSFESLDMGLPSYTIKSDDRFATKLVGVDEPTEAPRARGGKAGAANTVVSSKEKALEKRAKEEAEMRKFVARKQELAEKKAESERIQAKIAQERAAEKEAKAAERAAREKS